MKKLSVLIALVFILTGCARVTEVTKALWGSSTRALEDSRVDAISKTFPCSFDDSFNEVLKIAAAGVPAPVLTDADDDANANASVSAEEVKLTVFIKDRKRSRIVLMNIPNSIPTTEVGVFFLSLGPSETKIEIASLSPSAKTTAAEILFSRLSQAFPAIK
ncbi:MAG: hypothetical protein WC676_08160 [Candidatus Omnitrophota bacterium]